MVQNVTKSIVFEGSATGSATGSVAGSIAGSIDEVIMVDGLEGLVDTVITEGTIDTEVITEGTIDTEVIMVDGLEGLVDTVNLVDTEVESIFSEVDTIETMRVYNRNKKEIRNLKRDNLHIKKEVFFSFSETIRALKLEGFSTKKARVEALRTLKEKYGMCKYEVSLISFFDAFGIYPDVIAMNASRLHKLRSIVKTNDLTRKEVLELFK